MLNTGLETTIHALGQSWTISRLELRITRDFRDWIKTQITDPLAIGEKFFAMLPAEEQIARVKEAEAIKRDLQSFSLNCDLAKQFMATEEGAAKFLQLLLKQHHPEVTEEQAFSIAMEAGPQLEKAIAAAQGKMPHSGNGASPAA